MVQKSKNVSSMSNEARNSYVIEHISQALFQLLQEKPISDIRISEICEIAGVGRMSFYRNYKSKEDVIAKKLLALIQEWGDDFENKGDPNYFSESLILHYYNHKDLYLLLHKQGLSGMIHETILAACKLDEAESNLERYAKSMFAGMIWGWIDEWMRQGMPETPDELNLLTTQAR